MNYTTDDGFGENLARIKASMDKVNRLMTELKNLARTPAEAEMAKKKAPKRRSPQPETGRPKPTTKSTGPRPGWLRVIKGGKG